MSSPRRLHLIVKVGVAITGNTLDLQAFPVQYLQ
jgi:hypothetical protein